MNEVEKAPTILVCAFVTQHRVPSKLLYESSNLSEGIKKLLFVTIILMLLII